MKLRDAFYMLGWRPKPVRYGFEITRFDLPEDGPVDFAQWLHPNDSRKQIRSEVVAELRRYVAPGDTAIDIGAHTGDTTVPLALAVGASGCVLALEPNPYVFPVLKKNAELNRDKTNILPLMFAATESAGEMEFEYSDAGFCNGGMHAGINKWRHGHAFKLKVRGEHLPTYLAQHFSDKLPKLRLIKVDAEGYDYQVLVSLRPILERYRPIIRAEVFKLLRQEPRERLFDFLSELGYDVHLYGGDANCRGPQLARAEMMAHRHFDVFCLPRA